MSTSRGRPRECRAGGERFLVRSSAIFRLSLAAPSATLAHFTRRSHTHGSSAAMSAPSAFYPPGVPPPASTGDAIGPGAPSPFVHEDHPAFPIEPKRTLGAGAFSFLSPVLGPAGGLMDAWTQRRLALNLPSPGTAEHLQREVKSESSLVKTRHRESNSYSYTLFLTLQAHS